MTARKQLLAIAKQVARDRFEWPGGYAMFLVMADGGVLCPACVRKEWCSIVRYTFWNQPGSGWMPAGIDHTGNTDEETRCDHCDEVIE